MRIRGIRPREEGFSVIEAVMASMIVVLLFAGFGQSMSGAFQGSVDNLAAQEATALALEQLELARALDWEFVAMSDVDESAPMLREDDGGLDAEEAGLETTEDFVVYEEGVVDPMQTQVIDDTGYTVYSYITDAGDGLRRLTVLVHWDVDGAQQSYLMTTLISEVSTR